MVAHTGRNEITEIFSDESRTEAEMAQFETRLQKKCHAGRCWQESRFSCGRRVDHYELSAKGKNSWEIYMIILSDVNENPLTDILTGLTCTKLEGLMLLKYCV